jgi:hypothetical protein
MEVAISDQVLNGIHIAQRVDRIRVHYDNKNKLSSLRVRITQTFNE